MTYLYEAYRIPIISDIELPSLIQSTGLSDTPPIRVVQGVVPASLKEEPLERKPFSIFNENELLCSIPDVGRYYVCGGNYICIEPISNNQAEVLLYFYSNCLAAALLQRNLIPFHVSGVFVAPQKVLLFSASSKVGKSTTALMLQQKGYQVFTDDTALLTVKENKVFAQASYPMLRVWQDAFQQQNIYAESQKETLFNNRNKYGLSFHKDFVNTEAEVVGLAFLKQEGSEISIQTLPPLEAIKQLSNNIYRHQWISGMRKQKLMLTHLAGITNHTKMWQATRPKGIDTFDSFATAIETQIIQAYEY
ncbi:hypothetical protein [Emticicia sp. 17c]|uniref:hypothetical protein n=1 Tax=Emticicia sp. 17c TaxID=3127704 RepID=UPI00301E0DD9